MALVNRTQAWCVIRRLQQGDFADWLLKDSGSVKGKEIALEISGVNRGGISSRLSEKLKQVGNCDEGGQKWACVVGFEKPVAALQRGKRSARGN